MHEKKATVSAAGKETTANAEVFEWTKAMATSRALKVLGGFLGVTVITIFIPIVHFVTVPAGIIIGPIVALAVYNISKNTREWRVAAICPLCGHHFSARWSVTLKEVDRVCPACREACQIKIL